MTIRRFFLFITSICLFTTWASSSFGQSHPTDSTATYITTLTGTTELSATSSGEATYEAILWQMSDSTYNYVVDVETFEFSGSCSQIGSLSLAEIVEDVSDDAIIMGVEKGYPGCTNEAFVTEVDILSIVCANRSGSGCSISFDECGTEWCKRVYEVDCPGDDTDATITQQTGTTGDCGGSCSGAESSCPSSSLQ